MGEEELGELTGNAVVASSEDESGVLIPTVSVQACAVKRHTGGAAATLEELGLQRGGK
jgi:hypothetical protein